MPHMLRLDMAKYCLSVGHNCRPSKRQEPQRSAPTRVKTTSLCHCNRYLEWQWSIPVPTDRLPWGCCKICGTWMAVEGSNVSGSWNYQQISDRHLHREPFLELGTNRLTIRTRSHLCVFNHKKDTFKKREMRMHNIYSPNVDQHINACRSRRK